MPRWLPRAAAVAGALALALSTSSTAVAATASTAAASNRLVFVQTNDPHGNSVVTFERNATGRLVELATYPTGGNGGVLGGASSDRLASQGSLVYDRVHAMLLAVNAGSDSITAFTVRGRRLTSRETLPSGGVFPVSVAVSGDLVYVANALSGGSVVGFRITDGRLHLIKGSWRGLGLDPTATPQFVNTPGQVGFDRHGDALLVTTKANGHHIDVFAVRRDGRLSQDPVTTTLAGAVPFAFLFDEAGRLLMTEAATGALDVLRLHANGTITRVASVNGGQVAPCWITAVGHRYYVANTGSNSISGFRVRDTQPSFIVPGGVVANTDLGTIDLAAAGSSLYAMTGITGTIDEFRVRPTGTLVRIGSLVGAVGASAEGIAVTAETDG